MATCVWRLARGKAWAGDQVTARCSRRLVSSHSSWTLLLSLDQKLFTRKRMALFFFFFKSCPFADRHLMQVLTDSVVSKRWLAVGVQGLR